MKLTEKEIEQIEFTHYWVHEFGWENTIFCPDDFESVEVLGENEKDGVIFLGINDKGAKHILKGTTEERKYQNWAKTIGV